MRRAARGHVAVGALLSASAVAGCSRPVPVPVVADEVRADDVARAPSAPPSASIAPALAPISSYAGSYRFAYRLTREHGCSQSFETTSDHGRYDLRIVRDGAATLDLKQEHDNTFGPSPGRWREEGMRSSAFSHTTRETIGAWRGVATVIAAGVHFELASEKDGKLAFDCHRAREQALPIEGATIPDAGEVAHDVEVLSCATLPGLADLATDRLEHGAPLAIAPGLELHATDYSGYGRDSAALRVAPAD